MQYTEAERKVDRDAVKAELHAANPNATDAQLETWLDDLDAMERAVHPERFVEGD